MRRSLSRCAATCLVITAMACAPATASVDSFVLAQSIRIPRGSGPESISAVRCEECGACPLGFAFLGAADSLFFYDCGMSNLKVIPLNSQEGVARIVPGPEALRGRFYDGALAPDGTIYLLAEVSTLNDRFVLYARSATTAQWQHVTTFDGSDPLIAEMAGAWLQGAHSLRLAIDAGGRATVHPLNETVQHGLAIAQNGQPLQEKVSVPSRLDDASHHLAEADTPTGKRKPGLPFGIDRAGNLYYMATWGGARRGIEKHSRDGRLLARVELPPAHTEGMITGKGRRFVLPDGDVIQLLPDGTGLTIKRWTVQ